MNVTFGGCGEEKPSHTKTTFSFNLKEQFRLTLKLPGLHKLQQTPGCRFEARICVLSYQVRGLSHKLFGRLSPDGRDGNHPSDLLSLQHGRGLVLHLLKEESKRHFAIMKPPYIQPVSFCSMETDSTSCQTFT